MIDNLIQHRIHKTGYALGTNISLTTFGTLNSFGVDEAFKLIQRYEDLLTVNRGHSEMMSVNKSAGLDPVQVSNATYSLVKTAMKYSRQNFGFNAAIGPLVKLWKIGFVGANIPSDDDIKKRMRLIDPSDVELDDVKQSVFLHKSGMELDLGGIAKGYIADRIRDLWHSLGIDRGIIDLGGNVLFVGDSPNQANHKWIVGVQDPTSKRGETIENIQIGECSAVTSGIYERFLEIDGKKYHHVIDPRTGYPLKTDLAAVTVFVKNSIEGELEAKRLFFNNGPIPNWGADNDDLYGAVLVYQDGHFTTLKSVTERE
ncbi:FAD:protein FMN transferase [Companilactobacillus allii]|uniref:FAD:protein FMN transferase n=1 Tax=Companilactobacillus allii TaxID=1847728 RepID=A0A1P8Q1V5_9LACO|nr:FAD:protein FMN transferase [Companilactobacillus allii]APX71769.1 thiamine biosynthesis protein ApbE [Companilactobacillus allii]USQ68856.1 FAD:protein FMN transferase [Companilactobacillus allii]